MKTYFSFCLLLVSLGSMLAQSDPVPTGERFTTGALKFEKLKPGDGIASFDLRPTEPDGSPRYFEAMYPGAIRLRDGTVLSEFRLDYNIQRFHLVVLRDGAEYEVPGYMIREFIVKVPVGKKKERRTETKRFVNPNEYYDLPATVPYFLEAPTDDDPQPFKVYYGFEVDERAPNYNPALDVGSRTVRYLKKERRFFYDGTDVRMLPNNPPKTRKFFVDTYPNAERIIREQKLKMSNHDDVEELVRSLGN